MYIHVFWTYQKSTYVHIVTFFNPSKPCSVRGVQLCPEQADFTDGSNCTQSAGERRGSSWWCFCKNHPNIHWRYWEPPIENLKMIFGAPEFVPDIFSVRKYKRSCYGPIILVHDVSLTPIIFQSQVWLEASRRAATRHQGQVAKVFFRWLSEGLVNVHHLTKDLFEMIHTCISRYIYIYVSISVWKFTNDSENPDICIHVHTVK